MEKKQISLAALMMRYIIAIAMFSISIALVLIMAMHLLFSMGWVLPANIAETSIPAQKELLNDAFTPENIMPYYTYSLFNQSGEMLESNMEEKLQAVAQKIAENQEASAPYYFVLENETQILVLHYTLTPRYRAETLNQCLPRWDILMVSIWIISILGFCVFISKRFAKEIKQNIDPILDVTEKISKQNLEFDIAPSKIKELNQVNAALGDMKDALQLSLESNWQAEAEKNRQMSAIAHDIKTPLTIILSRTQLLIEKETVEKNKNSLQRIETSAEHIEYLITQLMNTSLDKSVELNLHDVNLSKFLLEIYSAASALAETKGQQVQLRYDNASIADLTTKIDANLMKRAFMNVIDNAVEHAPENAIISLTATVKEACIVVEICNSGSVFSDDVLQLGAELFYRGEKARTSDHHYGIGLYSTKEILEQHNGAISLYNDIGFACVQLSWPLC